MGIWGTGAVPVDLGIGRRIRRLGPLQVEIAAPRELVFAVLSEPYLARQTRAMAEKIEILERGGDMVLAAHSTPLHRGLVATTVETVRFSRPDRVDFRLTRGPSRTSSNNFCAHRDRRANPAGVRR